jgi:pimeloyl-ACP methyl ester carboxylesterase
MKNYKLFIALLSVVLVSACESEPATTLQDSIDLTTQPRALFDPSNGVIPFPNNLLFGDQPGAPNLDGTINIPVADAADFSDPQVALNALDGFSTIAPMSSTFTTSIDAATVNGISVKVYEVILSAPGGAVVAVVRQLTFGVEYFSAVSSVDPSQSTIAILPTAPLSAKTSYMVVITDDLMTTGSQPFGPSPTYLLIKNLNSALVFDDPTLPGALQSLTAPELASFEQLRQIVNVSEATVDAFDGSITSTDIIQSWSFTTQSIGDVLTQVRTDIRNVGTPPVTSLAQAGGPLGTSAGGLADIYVGTIDVPYYLTAASGVNDPTPLGSFWQGAAGSNLTQFNTTAIATSTETIPLMVSVPNTVGTSPFPVVIYQHGITSNRATMLAVADAFAAAGIAVVAIDLPLHGLTGNETNGTEFYKTGNERTFELDLVTQDPTTGDITAAVPDRTTDTSGRHYVNLTNLLNTRDNLRQSVSDLFALAYAVDNLSAGGNLLNNSMIYFLGHSLGSIVGTTFATLEPTVRDTVLANGGGSLPKILDGSAAFSPSIVAGLAAAGVNKGTSDYESFLGAAQTVVDSGDPVNYAIDLATKGEGILFFEMVGGSTFPSDLVVPNTVPDGNDSSGTVSAPLAGTEPMLNLMGLNPQVSADQVGVNLQHTVKFTAGSHSSLLDPSVDLAVTTEMQKQTVTFLASDGGFLDVTDPTDLLP